MPSKPDTRIRSIQDRNKLVTDHLWLADVVVRKLWYLNNVKLFGFDQSFSESSLALIIAAEHWEETRLIPFRAYAYRCMVNAITKASNKYNKIPHQQIDDAEFPSTDFIRKEEVDLVKSAILELPSQSKKVMWLLQQGKSTNEIAKLLDLPVCHDTQKEISLIKIQSIKQLKEILKINID